LIILIGLGKKGFKKKSQKVKEGGTDEHFRGKKDYL